MGSKGRPVHSGKALSWPMYVIFQGGLWGPIVTVVSIFIYFLTPHFKNTESAVPNSLWSSKITLWPNIVILLSNIVFLFLNHNLFSVLLGKNKQTGP